MSYQTKAFMELSIALLPVDFQTVCSISQPALVMFEQLLTQVVTLVSSAVSSLVRVTKDSLVNILFAQDAEKPS